MANNQTDDSAWKAGSCRPQDVPREFGVGLTKTWEYIGSGRFVSTKVDGMRVISRQSIIDVLAGRR